MPLDDRPTRVPPGRVLAAIGVVAAGAAAGVMGVLGLHQQAPAHAGPARVVVSSVAAALILAGLVLVVRHGGLRAGSRIVLPTAQWRRLRAAVRRDQVPPEADLTRLMAVAEAMRTQRRAQLTNVGLALLLAGYATGYRDPLRTIYLVLTVGLVAIVPFAIRDGRAADRFLRRPELYRDGISRLRRGWVGTGLGAHRPYPGMGFFEAASLPPVPALPADLSWLPVTRDDGVDYLVPAGAGMTGFWLPPSFVEFFARPELMAAVPSLLPCRWNLRPPVASPLRDGALLVRFLSYGRTAGNSSGRDRLHWWLWIGPDGGHRVLCGAVRHGEQRSTVSAALLDLIDVAPSFEEFLYRFWVENLAWFEVVGCELPEAELTPAVRDYLGGLAVTSSPGRGRPYPGVV